MTHLPFDRERILKWMANTSTDKLEAQLASAIRVGNSPRAALLQETLERRRQRMLARLAAAATTQPEPRQPARLCAPWRPIVEDVCRRHRVSLAEVTGSRRVRQVVSARHEAWWLLRQRGASLAEIGRRMGGFDHTSVRHGVLKWERSNG